MTTTRKILAIWRRPARRCTPHWAANNAASAVAVPASARRTPDYLPVIGGVAAITGCGSDAGIARVPGLFVLTALGAKGIAFSLLGAEIIAALASGEPLPVDSEVADAIDPARFLRRKQRKEAAAKQASTRINKPDAGATP
jgi:glycine/D-amino acid oxidase-like deaminating enzyme